MDDIIVRTETTLDDLQNRLNANEGFTNITESDIYGIASELAKMIFKNVPALKVIDALSTIVKVDSKLILEKIRYMVDNNYTVFVTKCERKAPKFIYGDISSLKNNDSISLFFIVLYF